MKTGRPLKFKGPQELMDAGMDYITQCQETKAPMTITGLALALDTTRETLMDYQERDEFSDTVKRLKLYCENFAEEMIFTAKNAAGPIFALKNYGWRDRQELSGPNGEPLPPMMQVNLKNADASELLRILTAQSESIARGRKGRTKAGRGS